MPILVASICIPFHEHQLAAAGEQTSLMDGVGGSVGGEGQPARLQQDKCRRHWSAGLICACPALVNPGLIRVSLLLSVSVNFKPL